MPILSNFQYGSNGDSLNIFTQNTQPSDLNGLWIKSSEVQRVDVRKLPGGDEFVAGDPWQFWMGQPSGSMAVGENNMVYYTVTDYSQIGWDHEHGDIYEYYEEILQMDLNTMIVTWVDTSYTSDYDNDYLRGTVAYYDGMIYVFYHDKIIKIDANTHIETSVSTSTEDGLYFKVTSFTMGEDGIGYFVTGSNGYSNQFKYDFKTDTKTQINMGITQRGYSIVYKDGIVYAFGGANSSYSSLSHLVLSYDTNSASTATVATIPNLNADSTVFFIGNRFYAFGGRGDSNMTLKINPFDWSCEQKQGLIFPGSSTLKLPGCAVNTKVYLFTDNGTQIYILIDNIGDVGTALAVINLQSPYMATISSSDKNTLIVPIEKVYMQTDSGVISVPSAVINDGVVTDIV